ncbi:MAG: hypothetical protein RR370_02825 [Synergistaceae bacterium]
MAKQKHDLQQTKGFFQVTGKVQGVQKDKFYVDTTTKTGKPFRAINFGVEFEKGKVMYISINGMEQEKVYFNKKNEETNKIEVQGIPWAQRHTFNEDGWRLIGTNIGLIKGDDGKNIKTTLTPFDSCEHINGHLVDDMSVFIKGNIEYSTYVQGGTAKRFTKFIPTQISLLSKEIDLDDLDYEGQANFEQRIVFTGIDRVEDEFKLTAKIVNYGSIEDAEFTIRDSKLAGIFKKNLKPYNSIDVHGAISVMEDVSQTQDGDDVWGETSKMQVVNAPIRRDLLITGASKSSLDTEVYTEELVMKAVKALTQDKKADEEWGNKGNIINNEEDGEW